MADDLIPERVETSITGGLPGPGGGEPVWRVAYTGTNVRGTAAFERHVSMTSGAVVTAREEPPTGPSQVHLGVPYPNPFRSRTTLPLMLQEPAHVDIAVYDALGRRVASLLQGHRPAGLHHLSWDGRDAAGRPAAPGLYLIRGAIGARQVTRLVLRMD